MFYALPFSPHRRRLHSLAFLREHSKHSVSKEKARNMSNSVAQFVMIAPRFKNGSTPIVRGRQVLAVTKRKTNDQFDRIDIIRALPDLSSAEKAVLKELVLRGNKRGTCFVSAKILAKDTGYCAKWVRITLKKLECRKLIRRWRRRRVDGSLGTYQTALTLPLSSPPCGTEIQGEGIERSAPNIKDQYKTEAWDHRFRTLEDDVFSILGSLIDREQNPELVSAYEVTKWACNRRHSDWSLISAYVKSQAGELAKELTQSGKRLESWETLIERMSGNWQVANAQISEKSLDLPDSRDADHPILVQLMKRFSSSEQINYRLNVLLRDCRFVESENTIVIHADKLFEANIIADDAGKLLQRLSETTGRSISVKFGKRFCRTWTSSPKPVA